jgi:hypothetical protein
MRERDFNFQTEVTGFSVLYLYESPEGPCTIGVISSKGFRTDIKGSRDKEAEFRGARTEDGDEDISMMLTTIKWMRRIQRMQCVRKGT